jgi:hypothetical protein
MDDNIKVITGKVSIFAGGHKDKNGKRGYRDAEGNFHAEFFKASISEIVGDKYHAYSWSIAPLDAEEIANAPMGTTFKVSLQAKLVEDDAGNMVPATMAGGDGTNVYHDCRLVDIDVDKIGHLERRRIVRYIDDVKAPEADADADIDG